MAPSENIQKTSVNMYLSHMIWHMIRAAIVSRRKNYCFSARGECGNEFLCAYIHGARTLAERLHLSIKFVGKMKVF